MSEINDEVQGHGLRYKTDGDKIKFIEGTLLVTLLVMLAAYFIIYNIFSISLVNDIHFYGMMKTIGNTSKQIKSVLNWQIYAMISPLAVLIGLFGGHLCGRVIAPHMIKTFTDTISKYYEPVPIISTSLIVVIFVFITLKISCGTSFKKVSKKYREA